MATDNHSRSVVKAISWLITREFKFALSIGLVELFTKVFLHYGHERLWNRISFGRVKTNDDYTI